MDLNNPTAHGERGRQAAKSLFGDGTYSLEEFHDTFLDLEDPTEYKPAISLVGTWVEWERLKRDWPGLCTHIQNWKAELEVKLKSRAIGQINETANGGNFQAQKWIAEAGYEKRVGAGKPTNAERKRAAKEVAQEAAGTKADGENIMRILEGGKKEHG